MTFNNLNPLNFNQLNNNQFHKTQLINKKSIESNVTTAKGFCTPNKKFTINNKINSTTTNNY